MGAKVSQEPAQFLLDNSIDDDTKDFLWPLDCLQNASFQRKYTLRHDFITSNSWLMYSLLGSLIIVYHVVIYFMNVQFYESHELFEKAMGNARNPYFVSLVIVNGIMFLSNVLNKEKNVMIILKLQSAKRAIRLTKKSFSRLTRTNWTRFGLCFLHLSATGVIVVSFIGIQYFMYIILNYFGMMFLAITHLYFIGLLKLLRALMDRWVVEMKLCIKKHEISTKLGNGHRAWRWKILYKAYCNMIEAYDVLKEASALTTSVFAMTCFVMVLGVIQNMVDIEKVLSIDPTFNLPLAVSTYATLTFALNYYSIACILSVECENMCAAVSAVNVECLMALKTASKSAALKKVLKNILRVNRHHFTKVKPFSLFTVDGTLPLKLGSFCTTYAVVLLQFQIL